MPLRSRPARPADDPRVNALIQKGGSTSGRDRAPGKVLLVQLRLEQRVLDQIDQLRQQRTVAPSRHAWMLEALLEKLAHDAAPRPRRRVT
jgi:hypothetical protein